MKRFLLLFLCLLASQAHANPELLEKQDQLNAELERLKNRRAAARAEFQKLEHGSPGWREGVSQMNDFAVEIGAVRQELKELAKELTARPREPVNASDSNNQTRTRTMVKEDQLRIRVRFYAPDDTGSAAKGQWLNEVENWIAAINRNCKGTLQLLPHVERLPASKWDDAEVNGGPVLNWSEEEFERASAGNHVPGLANDRALTSPKILHFLTDAAATNKDLMSGYPNRGNLLIGVQPLYQRVYNKLSSARSGSMAKKQDASHRTFHICLFDSVHAHSRAAYTAGKWVEQTNVIAVRADVSNADRHHEVGHLFGLPDYIHEGKGGVRIPRSQTRGIMLKRKITKKSAAYGRPRAWKPSNEKDWGWGEHIKAHLGEPD